MSAIRLIMESSGPGCFALVAYYLRCGDDLTDRDGATYMGGICSDLGDCHDPDGLAAAGPDAIAFARRCSAGSAAVASAFDRVTAGIACM